MSESESLSSELASQMSELLYQTSVPMGLMSESLSQTSVPVGLISELLSQMSVPVGLTSESEVRTSEFMDQLSEFTYPIT